MLTFEVISKSAKAVASSWDSAFIVIIASSVDLADDGTSTNTWISSESPSPRSSIVYLLNDTTHALQDSQTS